MAEHGKLPWRTSEIGLRMMIRDADAKIVAIRHRIDRREHELNFEMIVKAVNNHEALVKALQDIAAIENQEFGSDWEEIEQARKIANDALTAAGVGGEKL